MSTTPNASQIEYWNETSGARWVAMTSDLDARISPLGLLALDRLAPAHGERIVDVGCGCGQTSLQLAERVGEGGRVLGLDVSAPMLAHAAGRAREAGLSQVEFECGDAQTFAFEPGATDAIFSRLGVMFFEDPAAAFANLRRALRPGGRLCFLCWQALDRNPWMSEPLRAVARHVSLPPPPAPGAPGPHSFADPEVVRDVLVRAGFEAIALESKTPPLRVSGAGGLEEAVEFLLNVGPAAAALRDAPAALRDKTREAVREALAPSEGPNGVVLSSAIWIVTARNPDAS